MFLELLLSSWYDLSMMNTNRRPIPLSLVAALVVAGIISIFYMIAVVAGHERDILISITSGWYWIIHTNSTIWDLLLDSLSNV